MFMSRRSRTKRSGDATLGGIFDLGEGNYHVDWLMRDRSERVCSFYWDSEATLPPKDKQIALEMASRDDAALAG